MADKIKTKIESSPFNLLTQQDEVESKIVVGLERIAEVFRLLLWEQTKKTGVSPIQIQILIFLKHHSPEKAKISHLAKEFNLTKPTVSDSILALEKKDLIFRLPVENDSRSFIFKLSEKGEEIVAVTENFANPLKNIFSEFTVAEQNFFWDILSRSIYKLNLQGIISRQRMCFSCRYYEQKQGKSHCLLLNQTLELNELRIDCPEFIEAHLEM